MADISFRWLAEDTPGPTALRFGDPLSGPQAQIRVVGPLGTPQALVFKTLDRRAQIEVVGPLGAPQALGYNTLTRRADLSITGPLGIPQAFAYSYLLRTADLLLAGPLGTPTFLFKGTNLVEILGIVVEWNYSDWAFDLSFEWRFAGTEDEFTGELTYTGVFVIGAVEIPFSTTETHYTFGGIPPEVNWELDVRAGIDGPIRTVSGVTTREVPALVTGIGYTATVDSLTFYWDPAARADSYEARLYRDGALVELQEPVTEDAVFTGLEDGITYEIEVRGVNETAPGLSGTRTAITQYIAPTAPISLAQNFTHWVYTELSWAKPPEKVTFYESEITIADPYRVIHKGVIPAEPTVRQYGLPRAGTTYAWRIRAGNPGGLSAWAELDITTAGLNIDSRLAVLPACYQEDYLFPDTWDGGTDLISEGVGDPQTVFADPILTATDPKYLKTILDQEGVGVGIEIGEFTQRDALIAVTVDEDEGLSVGIEIGDFTQVNKLVTADSDEDNEGVSVGIEIGNFVQYLNLFEYTHDEHEAVSIGITIGNFTSEPPP